jgi:HSP20 family protein
MEVRKVALPTRRRDTGTWDPFAEITDMTHRLQEQMEAWRGHSTMPGVGFTPLADIEETDDAYTIEVELPGVKKSDVSIELVGQRVIISGEQREKERKGVIRRRTRRVGRFRYEVALPSEFDDSRVEATLKDGVLTLRLPKPASEKPRQITVS